MGKKHYLGTSLTLTGCTVSCLCYNIGKKELDTQQWHSHTQGCIGMCLAFKFEQLHAGNKAIDSVPLETRGHGFGLRMLAMVIYENPDSPNDSTLIYISFVIDFKKIVKLWVLSTCMEFYDVCQQLFYTKEAG